MPKARVVPRAIPLPSRSAAAQLTARVARGVEDPVTGITANLLALGERLDRLEALAAALETDPSFDHPRFQDTVDAARESLRGGLEGVGRIGAVARTLRRFAAKP